MDSRKIVITRASGKTQTFVPEAQSTEKQYYYIRQDDQIQQGFYHRNALNRPMVFRMETYRTIPFNRDMQFYCRDLNATGDAEYDKRTFADKWDTWVTNERRIREKEDRPGHANYVTGERLEKGDPSWATLVCGRNVVCGTENIVNGVATSLTIETLNPDYLPVGMTYETNPEFIHHCSVINDATYMDKHFGKVLHKVNPFPNNGGKAYYPYKPTYYPLMSRYPVTLPMWMLIKLPLGSKIPNPYNPEWLDWK